MTKNVLCGLIILTTVTVSAVYAAVQAYAIAALSIALGLIWFILEITDKDALPSVFFLFFLALVIVGTLANFWVPIQLISLSADLAAWDLSRFRARITNETEHGIEALLEARHLRKLAVAIGSGFIIALTGSLIRISIPFAVLGVVTLLTMIGLRQAMLSLRHHDKQ